MRLCNTHSSRAGPRARMPMPAAAASSIRQRRLMTPLRIRYTQHRARRMPPNSRALRLPVRARARASTAAVAR